MSFQATQIAMIGDSASLVAFRSLGIAGYQLDSAEEAQRIFGNVINKEYAVVFVTEPAYRMLEKEIAEVAGHTVPAVTIIPAVGNFEGIGGAKIEAAIERALGTKMPVADDGDESV